MKNVQRAAIPLLVLAFACGTALHAMDHPMIGQEAPSFTLTTLAGDNVSSSDLRGKSVVLHFGAGW